jgi:hypothetical protein
VRFLPFYVIPSRWPRSGRLEIDEVIELPGGLHRTTAHLTRPSGVVVHLVREDIERVPDVRVVVRTRFELVRNGRLERLATHTLAPAKDGTLMKSRYELSAQPGFISRLDTPREYSAFKKETNVRFRRLLAAITESYACRAAAVSPEPVDDDGT